MVQFFLVFGFINLTSLLFNALVFHVIYKQVDKSKFPTIYIYNTIIANSMDTFLILITFIIPIVLDDKVYFEFRRFAGSSLTIVGTFFYEHIFYLTILMTLQRAHSIKRPASKLVTDRRVWLVCSGFGVISLIILIIPFLSSCPVNINQRNLSFQGDCHEEIHPITAIQNNYLILIPVITMSINAIVLLYLAAKRGEALRRRRLNIVSISSTSNVHQLPPLATRSKSRQSFDRCLLLHSTITTSFLFLYELTGLLLRVFVKDFLALSETVRRFIFYSRVSTISLLCFLLYFVGTPAIRKLILQKVLNLLKGKAGHRTPTTTTVLV
ncbi:G-protein coupled receptors family 1 profile domain-containing protein [Caenorhabditis elegans]|uniref:G-protein coupled receptors family 1 profile domain-containing protein n=1 Tax=Caenorhabditis elegans TaxID=6239 RepID=O62450_CAEEL|nr:G-protein coupled receptors family 1 profile domain-containing protein [Caenorhabditis elegans]CAA16374.2 G-protein coupled receptors family 1 profile domain-containing protein [Caenorhabditis elegans]|eukprot:NP_507989.2 Serpentine Receptor, class XA [Caenorhabditis elegans]